MKKVPYLELHAVHTCNLSCAGCSHYSQHHVGGVVSLIELADWCTDWKNKIEPESIVVLGGEPTLHPELPQFILSLQEYWPKSKITLRTNGFFIHKHLDLRKVLTETNSILEVNCHSNEEDYLEKFFGILEHIQSWWDVRIELKNTFGGAVHKDWALRYHGAGSEMKPFNEGVPRQSWNHCIARDCVTLFEGRLWKCPPIAYLQLLPRYFPLSKEWDPYLAYRGIGPDCSTQELNDFFKKEDESICGMCPSRAIPYDKGNPLKNKSYPR
ncbi:radical SAM protein [bacterium]|nr:radical SAM protein [bacterium]